MLRVSFLLLALPAFISTIPSYSSKDEAGTCGYESCNPVKEGFINVHVVPHTHDDVGWLKTVDQYYYGSKSSIQKAGVQYILDTVITSLRKNPDRRFIYVETAFFWKWWIEQHDTVKSLVRKFVNNGQLEFIGGGWSMNDEAATHYHSIIDQMTWGLRKLNDTFGECGRPKIGWQIDPFGHSREMASIFAQLGYDAFLLGRIDYQEKIYRFDTKSPEMVWRSSSSLGKNSDIFTGVLYNTYAPPPGFCFDVLCDDLPIIDDKKIPDYNVDKRVDDFIEVLKNVSKTYETSNVLLTMGEDFHYQNAEMWFKNLDKLIKYTNERQANGSEFNVIYSTPSCYVKAIADEAKGKIKWPLKTDDFFPYASDLHAYWTGYFTSRPTSKRFEREGNNFLQVCKQLYALTDLDPIDRVDLNALREAMGIMQHHDAVTGTEKQAVADDYHRILTHGFDECQFVAASALSKIVAPSEYRKNKDEPAPAIPFESCLLSNVTQCKLTENNDNFIVTVYNPLSRPVNKYVRLPVTETSYSVKDSKGNAIPIQLQPIQESVLRVPERSSNATHELIFAAKDLPPLGFESFYVEKTQGNSVLQPSTTLQTTAVEIDQDTGLVSKITLNNVSIPLTQNFFYYQGFVGDNKAFQNRSSGAYIFRPEGNIRNIAESANVTIYEGEVLTEVQQVFNNWISQTIRVYPENDFVEFNWLIGPIPEDDEIGREIVTVFTTSLNSSSTFYTDSNGRELIKRIRNFRPTWPVELEEKITGNYYPVTSKIVIKDEEANLQVSVLNDRAQGGSSLNDGDIELMIHRNCLHDDAFGVGEALREQAFGKGIVARGSHYLVVGSANSTNSKTTSAWERDIAQRKLLDAWVFVSPTNGNNFEQYSAKYKMRYAGLKQSLPDNVQILTLEPWKGFSFLLRLEHVLEVNEDPQLSQPVTVDLNNLFEPFQIVSINETTLGGNQWLSDNARLEFEADDSIEKYVNMEYGKLSEEEKENRRKWNSDQSMYGNHVRRAAGGAEDDTEGLKVELTPMQIRTFVVEVNRTAAAAATV